MKKFLVSEECNACGQCVQMTDLLVENSEGKAETAEKGYISDEYLEQAKNIVLECPVNAITIIDTGNVKLAGKAGLRELKNVLENKLHSFEFPKVTLNDIKFNSNNYSIPIPGARGEYSYAYSSSSQAKNAGKSEFDRIMYSQFRPIILNVFIQYKNDKLQPFYTCERTEKSFYFILNRKIEKILSEIANEVNAITNGTIKLSNDFTIFDVYPDSRKDSYMELALRGFENRSTQSGIMAEFNKLSSTSLDYYASGLDTDDTEEYEGESFFGNSKYKTKWCYSGIRSACEDYIKDLTWAMDIVDIDEGALEVVQSLVNEYVKESKKVMEKKISDFSGIL